MAFDQYVPAGGLNGVLSEAEVAYVRGLIAIPQAAGRTPVLACNRTLGRIAAFKRAFGGTHILQYRNLFLQWASYSHQLRTGNPFFVESTHRLVLANLHDPFFAELASYARPRLAPAQSMATPAIPEHAAWRMRLPSDDLLLVFAAAHVYLSMHALAHADLLIDVTDLARGGDARRLRVEQTIKETCGLAVDLSDVRDTIELPHAPVTAANELRLKLEGFLALAIRVLDASPEQAAFGRTLVDDMWREQARFTFYSGAIARELERTQRALASVSAEHRRLSEQLGQAQATPRPPG